MKGKMSLLTGKVNLTTFLDKYLTFIIMRNSRAPKITIRLKLQTHVLQPLLHIYTIIKCKHYLV